MLEENILRLLKNFRISISNLQLYPKESALVRDTIKLVFDDINELLKDTNSIVLGEADRNLLINGEKHEFIGVDRASANSIIEMFINNNTKSITFTKGINIDELILLLDYLSKKKRAKDDTISKLISDNNITHISANEKVYVVAADKDQTGTGVGEGDGNSITSTSGRSINDRDDAQEEVGKVKGETDVEGFGTSVSGTSKPGVAQGKSKREILLDEVQSLIEKKNEDLLEVEPKKLNETIRELDNIERVDLSKNVVDKIASNLESTVDEVRLKTVKSFKETIPTIESLSDKKVFDDLHGKFIVAEDSETNEEVYTELADLLEYGANEFLKEGNYTRTIEIVSMFREHHFTRGEGFIKRWQIAEKVLSKLANPYIIGVLISDLKSDDSNRKNQAYTVIMKLQNAAIPSLIEAVKETEDIHLRKVIAFAIRNTEEKGIEKLVNEIDTNTSPEIVKRITDVLNGVGSSEVIVNRLKGAFKHYSPVVRKEIMRTLCKINTPESLEILTEAVNDKDVSISKDAITMLGKVKSKNAVDILIPLLKQKSIFDKQVANDELLEEACLALGKIKDKRALSVLIDIARGSGFLKFKKQFSKPVRLASISALAYFIVPESKEVLLKLKNSKDNEISKSADNSLKMQERTLTEKGESLSHKII